MTTHLSQLLAALLLVSTACWTAATNPSSDQPEVRTTSGILQGIHDTANSHPLVKFLGVPYAEAPVGQLRFKPSVALLGQSDERLDAGQFRSSCMQPPHLRKVIYSPLNRFLDDKVDEDCLYLNIYVPTTGSKSRAVMVWIPGEGYDFGNGNQYDGSYLATSGDVIVVTINYRLSVFGFLSVDTEEAPGNAGLTDQLAALRWLKQNVANFGGNPEKITLFGRLSGSMSISALMAAPSAKGLFRRAILQSGIADNNWVFERRPLEQAQMFARNVNCSSEDQNEMVGCLRQVPAEALLKAAFAVNRPWRLTLGNVLPEAPLQSKKLANVDVMLGATEHEGSLCLLSHLALNTEYMDKLLDDTLTTEDLNDLVYHHVQDYYGDASKVLAYQQRYSCKNTSCRAQFLTFCGDLFTHSANSRMASKLVRNGNLLYRYLFNHRPSFSHFPEFVGAAQGDEVLFVFGLVNDPALQNVTKDEVRLADKMMAAWTNFAISGNPNPVQKNLVWPAFNEKQQFLELTTDMSPGSVKSAETGEQPHDIWESLDFVQL